jgi:hypothetical protein
MPDFQKMRRLLKSHQELSPGGFFMYINLIVPAGMMVPEKNHTNIKINSFIEHQTHNSDPAL